MKGLTEVYILNPQWHDTSMAGLSRQGVDALLSGSDEWFVFVRAHCALVVSLCKTWQYCAPGYYLLPHPYVWSPLSLMSRLCLQ